MGSFRSSIQQKILLLLLVLALPPLLLVGWLGLTGLSRASLTAQSEGVNALRAQAERALNRLINDKALAYDNALSGVEQQVESLARYAEVLYNEDASPLPRQERIWISPDGPSAAELDRYANAVAYARSLIPLFQGVVASNKLVNLSYIGLAEGGVSSFNDEGLVDILSSIAPFDVRERPWYTQAVAAKATIWTDAYVDANSGTLTTTCATPVFAANGDIIGVIGFDLLLTTIQQDLLTVDFDGEGYAFLINRNGDVVVRPDLQAENTRWNEPFRTERLTDSPIPTLRDVAIKMSQGGRGLTSLDLNGEPVYLAYAPIPTADWSVGLVIPAAAIDQPAIATGQRIAQSQDQLFNQLVFLLVGSALGIGVAGLLASLSFTRRIRVLKEGAALVASGQLRQRLPPAGRDEIGQLVDTFNSMTVALDDKVVELEQNAEQLATLNEVSNHLKTILEEATLLKTIPEAICERFGFDRAAVYLVDNGVLKVVSASFGLGNDDQATRFITVANAEPLPINGSTVEADVIRSRKAIIVNNPWDHPRVHRAKQAVSDSHSYVQVPIFGRDERVLGLISADYYVTGRSVQPQDAGRLLMFASMVGLTIENVQLYADLERQVAQRTEELRAALERAQLADKRKSDFLSAVSHELRTPLNAIVGFSTVLLDNIDGPLSPPQREDVQSINRNGRFLLHLINELLDLARIEAGHLLLDKTPVRIPELANEVVDTMQALLRGRSVAMKCGMSRDLPPIDADADRIRQILFNLLSNAVKFTERGAIIVTAHQIEEVDAHAKIRSYVQINVRDTGIGIPSDQQGQIFEEFSQVHGRRSRMGGTGLGLAIVKRLVEAHEGRIWVRSAPGVGSTFSFTIPVYIPVDQRLSVEEEQPVGSRR
jgi:two-component system, sensor histidine kinase and response regulator